MADQIQGGGRVPLATYRFQLNRSFRFRDAASLVPYLQALGISDLYASPYLRARSGSLHGYDISNHNELNPEIGFRDDHEEMTDALRERGMGHLIDIVPNHMGIGESGNRWWMDVLENGPSSPFAKFFDIDWHPLKRELDGKVLLPVLGDQFGDVLERGELKLVYEEGRFRIEYFENEFPVAPRSTAAVLRAALELLESRLDEDHPERMELASIVTALEHLPPRHRTDRPSISERRREKTITQRRLASLTGTSAEVREALREAVQLFNGSEGHPTTFDRLEELLSDQAYRLAFWRVAAEEINYRRFFDINDLAGVRVERQEVFDETHRLILRLMAEDKVTSLRIDHPDGLFDPRGYLYRLQEEAQRVSGNGPVYILVEKILTGDEQLPDDWPVAGTVGYDLMDRLNRILVAADNEEAMNAAYKRFVPRTPEFEVLIYDKKKLILRSALASELNVLGHQLNRLSERSRRSRDFTLGSLTDALREIIACFPVYRTYIDARIGRVSDNDRSYIEQATDAAMRRNRSMSASVFAFVRDTLLLNWPQGLNDESRAEHAEFVMKFQQLTGPVMAKGVEDTSFYIFNRLVSLNEVGGEPDRFGITVEEFHTYIADRAKRWPHAMNSTSTHDTKRSEDVRARIHVLSEIPEMWARRATEWARSNEDNRSYDSDLLVPDRNDEYLLYQTLIGSLPLEELDDEAWNSYVGRVQGYMEKATREAKVHTSWINPNEAYDQGLKDFIARILDRTANREFVEDLHAFYLEFIAVPGMLNGLSQALLKLTLPGVPDIYQGQETWDFSLVDPDNRRPVDYELRRSMLEDIRSRQREVNPAEFAAEILRDWRDGRIKMYLTQIALEVRRRRVDLFTHGEYRPLLAVGERGESLLAFARVAGDEAGIVVVPRLMAGMVRENGGVPAGPQAWKGTRLKSEGGIPKGLYRNLLTGEEVEVGGSELEAAALFNHFPLALLERQEQGYLPIPTSSPR
jgi:(1->4)-alpha-D-glucan 1-alpha-D-glucosylmutase